MKKAGTRHLLQTGINPGSIRIGEDNVKYGFHVYIMKILACQKIWIVAKAKRHKPAFRGIVEKNHNRIE